MKRVLVAATHHESNSFNPIITGSKDLRVLRGQEIFDNIRDNDSLSGIIVTLKEADIIICKLGYLTPGHEAIAKKKLIS